jgi:GT2 family glycosyltransferase
LNRSRGICLEKNPSAKPLGYRTCAGILGATPTETENSTMTVPMVSIIVLNYNGAKFAQECLKSVLATRYPRFEVIVVDNASTDGSCELISKLFPGRITLVRNSRNLGYADGNNIGFQHSKGDIIAFLNIDTEVAESWLIELVKALDAESMGAVQSALIKLGDRQTIDSLGWTIDPVGYGYAAWLDSQRAKSIEPFYAEGSAMAIKRETLNEVMTRGGPFDSDYFIYFEDLDLSWRLRLRGYRVSLVRSSIVYHSRGYGLPDDSYAKVYYNSRNRIMTLMKNYDLIHLFTWVSLLILLETVRTLLFLCKKPLAVTPKLRGITWNLTHLRHIWKKRAAVQSTMRKISDSEIAKTMIKPNLRRWFLSTYP